jgi:peptidoglycan/LPS O-acetylase OafA/YrhL
VAAYFVLFVPFVVNLTYGNHFLTPLWSVGVEEMYYLAWAPIVKWFRRRLLVIMLAMVAVKALLAAWAHSYSASALAHEMLRMLQFEAMAIGGLAAYCVFHRAQPLHAHWLFSKPAQVLLMLPLAARLFAHQAAVQYSPLYAAIFDHAAFTPLLLMTLFAWFIVNVSLNEHTIIRFDFRVLNYLGDISYGVYMYHALVISLVFVPFLDDYRAAPGILPILLLHLLVAAFTLLFAALSKKLFEDRFLRYKARYAAGSGGPPAISRDNSSLSEPPVALAA